MFSLTDKTCLVTGASSGLGAHFARVLSDSGARVVLAARRLERLESLAEEIRANGRDALPVVMDVTDPASVDAAFEAAEAEFGPIHVLVNNSGVSREGFFTDMSEADWRFVMDANLDGVWRVAKRAANGMKAAETVGSIINISSITALRTSQMIAAYAASKAAVDHLTRVMALEGARFGIRVNAIAPGYFKTDINSEFLDSEPGEKMRKRIPMRRFGAYENLSGPLLLLASEAGAYMTGETIVVDGGHTKMGL